MDELKIVTQHRIAVMQAFVDGKEIEAQCKHEPPKAEWYLCRSPGWDWDTCEYRVRREPFTRVDVRWVVRVKEGGCWFDGRMFDTRQEALRYAEELEANAAKRC
jgi:hypothetical protein